MWALVLLRAEVYLFLYNIRIDGSAKYFSVLISVGEQKWKVARFPYQVQKIAYAKNLSETRNHEQITTLKTNFGEEGVLKGLW